LHLGVGVDDAGTRIGLDLDAFRDLDKFGLHLNNFVKDEV
jgi:hypothetical protein